MPFFLVYILKVSVSLAVVFLFYHFILRKLTFYNWNRWFLFGYSILSFFIPFIDISGLLEKNQWTENAVVQWVPVIGHSITGTEVLSESSHFSTAGNFMLLLVLAGMLVLSGRLLLQYLSFRKMMKTAKMISGDGTRIYQVDQPIIPFSFGNSIFINQQLHSATELQEIIRHEFVHVRQAHSMDIIWGELLCLLNWYNPFAWLLKKSIRQNLEFIADHQVLENGISKKEYQYLLLKVTGNNQYSIATPFNFSSLKKRIAMMNKMKSAKAHLVKFLILLPVLAIILVSFRKQMNSFGDRSHDEIFMKSEFAVRDTLPEKVKQINIRNKKANVTLKDGSKEQYDLNDAGEKKEFERKYGKVPPPPPPPPAPMTPPAPPAPADLPDNVQRISVDKQKATVWLKNGDKENFDLSIPSQKNEFEKKYGAMPPPPPPAPPVPAKPVKETAVKTPTPPSPPAAVIPATPSPAKVDAEREGFDLNDNYTKVDASNFNSNVNRNVVSIRNVNGKSPLIILDGKIISNEEMAGLDKSTIASVDILKDKEATSVYGDKGKEGVIRIRTKDKPGKEANPLIVLDGKIITKAEMEKLNPDRIESMNVLKGKSATDLYPEKGKEGVIVISSKKI